jgi:hypothetical protein
MNRALATGAIALVLAACQAPPTPPAPTRLGVADVASLANTPIPAQPVTIFVPGTSTPMASVIPIQSFASASNPVTIPPDFAYRALGGANGFGSTYGSGNTIGGL